MKVKFESKFLKDIEKLKDPKIAANLKEVINNCKIAQNLNQISQLKKLKGYKSYYRLRVGDYRIGLELAGDEIIFIRFLHRREIYKFFP